MTETLISELEVIKQEFDKALTVATSVYTDRNKDSYKRLTDSYSIKLVKKLDEHNLVNNKEANDHINEIYNGLINQYLTS